MTNASDDIFMSAEEYKLMEKDDVYQKHYPEPTETFTQNITEKIETEARINNLLDQLDYNNLHNVQDMLYLTLKRLNEKEQELLLYQKKCRAYEKVISVLKKEIKVIKTNGQNK